MKTLPLIFCLCFLASSSSAQALSSLEGKAFEVKLDISGKSRPGMKWISDELSFRNGKLISKVMSEKEHFPPFKCTLMEDSLSTGKIHFSASGKNNAVSEIEWEGTISGNGIEGIAVWTNANGPQTQHFSGVLKEKK